MTKLFISILLLFCLSTTGKTQTDLDSLVWDFGAKLENSFHENDLTFFKEHFNNSVFIKSIFDGYIEPDRLVDYFKINKISEASFIQEYLNSLKYISDNDGYLYRVTYYLDGYKNYYLIFRLDFEDSINYHEFYLDIEEDNITISDVFMYTSGERFSSTLQNLLLPSFSEFEGVTLSPRDSSLLKAYKVTRKALGYRKQNQHKAGRKYFKENVDFDLIKEDKILMLNYLGLFDTDAEPDAYLEALTVFFEQHSNNVTAWLMGIDYHYMNEDYDECLNVIDSLYQATGDDYLNLYRGNAYSMKNDNENAKKYLKKFITNFPYTTESYDSYIYLACEENDFEELMWVAESLKEYLELNYYSIADIYKTSCPDFYNSKIFQDWLPKDDGVYNLKGDFFSYNTNSFSTKMKMELNEPGIVTMLNNPDVNFTVSKFDMFMEMDQIGSTNKIEQINGAENEISMSFIINGESMDQTDPMSFAGKKITLEKNKNNIWKATNKSQFNKEELKELKDIVDETNKTEQLELEEFSLFIDSVKVGDSWDITEADFLKYFRSEVKGKDIKIGKMTLNEVVETENDKLALVRFNLELKDQIFDEFKVNADCGCNIERSLISFTETDITCDCNLELEMKEENETLTFKINSGFYMLLEVLKEK